MKTGFKWKLLFENSSSLIAEVSIVGLENAVGRCKIWDEEGDCCFGEGGAELEGVEARDVDALGVT